MLRTIIAYLFFIFLVTACRSSRFNESHGIVIEPISEEIKKDLKVIKLKKSIGVIFPKEYKVKFNQDIYDIRFTPTEKEIREAEVEINKQYLETDKNFLYKQNFEVSVNTDWNLQERQKNYINQIKWAKKEAKRSIKFDRQYIGYIVNGKKKLLINFLDFSKDPYHLKSQISNSFIDGWHGWFETNTRMKVYTFTTKKLGYY